MLLRNVPRRALAVVLVLAAVLVTVQLTRHSAVAPGAPAAARTGRQADTLAPRPEGVVPADAEDVALRLLRARATAVRDRDPARWLTTTAPGAYRDRQQEVADRIVALRPALWRYRWVVANPAEAGAGWTARVDLEYRLDARGPLAVRSQYLTVAREDGGDWRITGDTAGPTQRDVWDLGPVTSSAAARCRVIGATGRRAVVRRIAGLCGGAASAVDTAWPESWPRRTVVFVPADRTQFALLLGDDEGEAQSLGELAAVTSGPVGRAAEDVVVSPDAWSQLTAAGQRVVVTHEFTHVAARATYAGDVPTWLAEGYADWVAYRAAGLGARVAAAPALASVRGGRIPENLPADEDFGGDGAGPAIAYSQAWLAVDTVTRALGPARTADLCMSVANSDDTAEMLDQKLADVGGTAGLTTRWRQRLVTLAKEGA